MGAGKTKCREGQILGIALNVALGGIFSNGGCNELN